jgi:hypothetical protein
MSEGNSIYVPMTMRTNTSVYFIVEGLKNQSYAVIIMLMLLLTFFSSSAKCPQLRMKEMKIKEPTDTCIWPCNQFQAYARTVAFLIPVNL